MELHPLATSNKKIVQVIVAQSLSLRRVRTTAGPRDIQAYGVVWLTIQGRNCRVDVLETHDDCPVLIGQVPLELLDFVIDPTAQRLIGNPAHGGQQMYEMY